MLVSGLVAVIFLFGSVGVRRSTADTIPHPRGGYKKNLNYFSVFFGTTISRRQEIDPGRKTAGLRKVRLRGADRRPLPASRLTRVTRPEKPYLKPGGESSGHFVAWKCMASRLQKAPAEIHPSFENSSMTSSGIVALTGQ